VGIILIINPFETAKFLLVVVGVLAFLAGIVMIALSIQMKKTEN
jgi:uncharacterized membrane protein HdeD (DUF308 family)